MSTARSTPYGVKIFTPWFTRNSVGDLRMEAHFYCTLALPDVTDCASYDQRLEVLMIQFLLQSYPQYRVHQSEVRTTRLV